MLASLAVSPARAQEDAPARTSVSLHGYVDDDGLTVWHPSASASAGGRWRARATYDADVITAATVDVRTSASVRPFHETRHGLALGLAGTLARGRVLDVRASTSQSPDYRSVTVGSAFTFEDETRRDTVRLSIDGSLASVGRAGDPDPVGELGSVGGSLAWSRVLSPRWIADLALAGELLRGVQESPYRSVRIGEGLQRLAVPEAVPNARHRVALALGMRAALSSHVFARARLRLHADDWGVRGYVLEPELVFALASPVELSLTGALGAQHGARFRRGSYASGPEVPRWRTHDRELASGFHGRAQLGLRWRFLEREHATLAVSARGGFERHRFLDTPLLPRRTAALFGLSLVGEWP
ncbi:MAG: DUF3570 domain-containing protein [Myxococcota bacterium]|jgi:hypothetical protein|nr:DUF3570 domain-containing protein [Myxococcota bacterium]